VTSEGKAHSVHDRLLALSRESRADFNLILIKYALERYLYRISASSYRDSFLLKGALLFSLWYDTPRRPTRDADLLGLDPYNSGEMTRVFQEICGVICDDGMVFLPETVQAVEIREDTRYGGTRVSLIGKLGNARCNVQVDIGYGDAVTPDPQLVRFPPLLVENPPAELRAYPKETVIAEKLEAIVALGMANSRMKDYFDLSFSGASGSGDAEGITNAAARVSASGSSAASWGSPPSSSGKHRRKACEMQTFLSWKRGIFVQNAVGVPSFFF
jgi:Uncharacterized conserved protein